jgi:hypothetical protein
MFIATLQPFVTIGEQKSRGFPMFGDQKKSSYWFYHHITINIKYAKSTLWLLKPSFSINFHI